MAERREIVFSSREDNTLSLMSRIKSAMTEVGKSADDSSKTQISNQKELLEGYQKEIELLDKKRTSQENSLRDTQRVERPETERLEIPLTPKEATRVQTTEPQKPREPIKSDHRKDSKKETKEEGGLGDKFYADREKEVAKRWREASSRDVYVPSEEAAAETKAAESKKSKQKLAPSSQEQQSKPTSKEAGGKRIQEMRIERLRIRELRIDDDKSKREGSSESGLIPIPGGRKPPIEPPGERRPKTKPGEKFNPQQVGSALQGKGPSLLGSVGGGPMALGLAITGLVAGFIKTAYTNEMDREQSLSQLSAISGTGVKKINQAWEGGYFGRGGMDRRGRTDYGFSEEEFMQSTVPTAQSYGTSKNINKNVLDSMAIERGTGLDSGLIGEMNKLSRVMSSASSSTDITQSVYKAMQSTGALGESGQDLSRLSEIMKTFVSHQESNFMRTGNISTGDPFLNLRSRLESTGEDKFKRDDYSANTIGSLNQGLYSQGTPEVQAMKMDILRRQNPDKGYFELQAEQEKGIESEGYLQGVMDLIEKTNGNLNQKSILFDQMTGGVMNKGDILSLMKGGMDLENIQKSSGEGATPLDIEGRADRATSELRSAIDNLTGEMAAWTQAYLGAARSGGGVLMPGSAVVTILDEIRKILTR